MKQSTVTYEQLDKALRSLGFVCRPARDEPPGRVYEHKEAGALIILPNYRDHARVFEHHLIAVRTELDNFGLADPTVFADRLQKTG